ncbi:MAG: hypothetical protein LWX00_02745 [Spirochaetia bacterium]|nr:hypothetical protein [Spirochaetia bacterium]
MKYLHTRMGLQVFLFHSYVTGFMVFSSGSRQIRDLTGKGTSFIYQARYAVPVNLK